MYNYNLLQVHQVGTKKSQPQGGYAACEALDTINTFNGVTRFNVKI